MLSLENWKKLVLFGFTFMERGRKKWYLEEKGRELKHQAEIKVISEWCFVEWMNADLMRFISNILQGQQGNPNYAGWPSSLLIRVMCLIKEVQFFLVLQEANRKPAASIHPVSPSLLHTQAQTKSCSAASLTPCILMHTLTPPSSPFPAGAAYHAWLQKKAWIISSSRWGRGCRECHGQLTNGGKAE